MNAYDLMMRAPSSMLIVFLLVFCACPPAPGEGEGEGEGDVSIGISASYIALLDDIASRCGFNERPVRILDSFDTGDDVVIDGDLVVSCQALLGALSDGDCPERATFEQCAAPLVGGRDIGEVCLVGVQCTSSICRLGETGCGVCAPCRSDLECPLSAACLITDEVGSCVAAPDEGEPCTLRCQAGLSCERLDGAALRCVRPAASGEECPFYLCAEPDVQCADNSGGAPTCQVTGSLGEACPRSRECERGLFCDGAICTPLRSAGEVCTLEQTSCEPGLVCSDANQPVGPPLCRAVSIDGSCGDTLICPAGGGGCLNGQCTGLRGDGVPCPAADTCATGLACFSGVCRAPVEPESCEESDAVCGVNNRCVSAQCRRFREVGETCDGSTLRECRPELRCVQRRCAEPTRELGESCLDTNFSCVTGLICDRTLQQECIGIPNTGSCGTCAPPAFSGVGEACDQRSCASGLRCSPDREAPICYAPALAVGDDCSVDGLCGTTGNEGLVCHPVLRTCIPVPPLGLPGEPCPVGGECSVACDRGSCIAARGENETCGQDPELRCLAGLGCVLGHCEPLRFGSEVGNSCSPDRDFSTCGPRDLGCSDEGVCVAVVVVDVGAACSEVNRCARGAYCSDERRCVPLPLAGEACTALGLRFLVQKCGDGSFCLAGSTAGLCEGSRTNEPCPVTCASFSDVCVDNVCVPWSVGLDSCAP